MARLGYGYVLDITGNPQASVAVTITGFAGVYGASGAVAPSPAVSLTTDAAGRYETDLVVGARYLVAIPGDIFAIVVPAGATDVSIDGLRGSTGQALTN